MKGKNLVLLATNRAELFAPTGVGFLIGAGLRMKILCEVGHTYAE